MSKKLTTGRAGGSLLLVVILPGMESTREPPAVSRSAGSILHGELILLPGAARAMDDEKDSAVGG